jgi:hypothetical protein
MGHSKGSVMHLSDLYVLLDPFLIGLFRMSGYSFVDFLAGTFVLALVAVIVGEFTISLGFLITRKAIEENTDRVARYQSISVDAIEAGHKAAYTAANKLANDAFGRSFFQQIALASGFLWPIPFVLGWMQYRFGGVEFDVLFTDWTAGYTFVFVPLYVAAYLVFKRVKYRIPHFRRIKRMLDEAADRHKNMRSFGDLFREDAAPVQAAIPRASMKRAE